jgi:hypothetical protein
MSTHKKASKATKSTPDNAIKAWREAVAAHKSACTQYDEAFAAAEKSRGVGAANPIGTRLHLLGLEIEKLEREDAVYAAQMAASAALDAVDGVDVKALGDCLADDDAEIERLKRQINDVIGRASARIVAAEASYETLTARRQQANLPPPVGLPQLRGSFGPLPPRQCLEVLAQRLEDAPAARNENRLHILRFEEDRTLAEIERQRIEAEKREAEEREAEEREAAYRLEEERRAREQHEALVAKYKAEQAEEKRLAAAARARLGVA